MKGQASADDADKETITFDTESDVFEEMKAVFSTIQLGIPDDSPHLAFKNRFNEVYDFFVSIFNKNQKLLQKAHEGNAEIIINANKISTILKIAREDSKKLGKYKKEYTEALNLIQTLHTAEEKSKELLKSLRSTITTLNGQIQRGEAFCYGEEDNIATIIQDVKNLKREKKETAEEINETNSQIKKEKETIKYMNDQITILTNNSKDLEKQIHDYQSQLNKITNEVEIAKSQIDEVRPIVDDQKSTIEINTKSLREHENNQKELMKKNNDISKQLMDQTVKLKQLRYHVAQQIQQQNKLMKRNLSLTDQLERLQSQNDISNSEYDSFQKDLSTQIATIETSTELLQNLSKQFDSIEEKKREARVQAKNLREKLTHLTHDSFIQDAERNRTVRHIESANHGITAVSALLDGEKIETANVNALNYDLNQEKRMQKRKMQDHKVKIRLYEQEIESKVYERMQVERRCQLVEDERDTNFAKVIDDNATLDDLQAKIRQQDELMDVLRKERNNFKRKLLICAKEKVQLIKQQGDLEEDLTELKRKNREMLFTITDEHFTTKAIKQQLLSEGVDVSMLRERVKSSSESINHLQSQRQLMRHVLNDASGDKALVLKEIGAATASKNSIVGTLGERNRIIEQLKGNILTLQQNVERGKLEYEKLLDSLTVLVSEVNKSLEKNEYLEKKIERIKFAENDERRLNIYISRENQKFSTLIREISIPRNVHRWQMYSATDPQYQKNLLYLSQMYIKLDKAHRYLVALEKKRDDLKKEVEENKKKVIPNGENEKASFQYHIHKYKKDIDQKDKLIDEMLHEIRENRMSLKNMVDGVDTIRSKCNERRQSVSQLRSRKLESKVEKRQQAIVFMTEPETLQPLGGGFVQKIQSTTDETNSNSVKNGIFSTNKIVLNENQMILDGKTPRKKINHTPRTPKGQQKRIMRPQTANRRRPLTALQTLS